MLLSDLKKLLLQKKPKIDHALEALLFHWEWLDNDSGIWTPYSNEMNEKLNKAFVDHKDTLTFKLGNEDYEVDFKLLQQTNLSTKFKRQIHRIKNDGGNAVNPYVVFRRRHAKSISRLALELKCTAEYGFGSGCAKIAGAVWKMLKTFDEEIETFNKTAKDDEKKPRIKVLEECTEEVEIAQKRFKNITQHKKGAQDELDKKRNVLNETEKKNKETREALQNAEAGLLKATIEKNYNDLTNLASKVSELGIAVLVLDQEVTHIKTEIEELEAVLKYLD